MNFYNNCKADFLHFFGQAALDLLEGYTNVHLILAETGMFPMLEELGPAGGCVVHIDPTTLEILPADESKRELALILYPENIHNETKDFPVEFRDKYRVSTVAHELEHVKQVQAGRLRNVRKGHIVWEGQDYFIEKLDAAAYVQYPWEREAYLAQFAYISDNSEHVYQQMVNSFTQQ